jgi:hypothetical protein
LFFPFSPSGLSLDTPRIPFFLFFYRNLSSFFPWISSGTHTTNRKGHPPFGGLTPLASTPGVVPQPDRPRYHASLRPPSKPSVAARPWPTRSPPSAVARFGPSGTQPGAQTEPPQPSSPHLVGELTAAQPLSSHDPSRTLNPYNESTRRLSAASTLDVTPPSTHTTPLQPGHHTTRATHKQPFAVSALSRQIRPPTDLAPPGPSHPLSLAAHSSPFVLL